RAVEIASEHAKAERERPGMRVEERLLLDRVALNTADITPRDAQVPAAVEAHLAHADGAVGNRALVSARVTADAILGDVLDELRRGLSRSRLENIGQGGHAIDCTTVCRAGLHAPLCRPVKGPV